MKMILKVVFQRLCVGSVHSRSVSSDQFRLADGKLYTLTDQDIS